MGMLEGGRSLAHSTAATAPVPAARRSVSLEMRMMGSDDELLGCSRFDVVYSSSCSAR